MHPSEFPETAEPTPLTRPSPSFVQKLLDPQSLQILMGAGGGLVALGVVLWLAVIGVFDNPVYAAVGLAAANFALLAGGVQLALNTRHKLAGRATAMLACLLLPLNLWFYDAQGLITLDQGGNLWAPALVCCIVYALVAQRLKDSLFVYAFTGGVAMTGLLFLADGEVGRFWEVLAPSTLLVALGIGAVHLERIFPIVAAKPELSAFTRNDFGRAFFRAGQLLLAAGLVLLLGGRLTGRLYDVWFAELGWFAQAEVATVLQMKLAAMGLVFAGAYAYGYSRFITGQKIYTLLGALLVLWSGLIGCDILGIVLTPNLLMALLGGLSVLGMIAVASESLLTARPEQAEIAGRIGRLLLPLAGAAGSLLATTRLIAGETTWTLLAMLVVQVVAATGAAWLSSAGKGRGLFVATVCVQLFVAVFTLNALSSLTIWQRGELFATAIGAGLLSFGHLGWRREVEAADKKTPRASLVDEQLWLGSLLATIPLTLGLIGVRLYGGSLGWTALHEIGVLSVGLLLLSSGVLCRLRATTLTGGAALGMYLLSLFALIDVPDQLQTVAVYLMAGGGALFAIAVLLSVYRDRLLALPGRIREGEGVFAVLKWR